MQAEGVIKFDLQFSASEPVASATLADLNAWRRILWQLQLIGQDPARYGGYGFGNVSQRMSDVNDTSGKRRFIISGTQTGDLPQLDASHYAIVNEYDAGTNRVVAEGPVRPSSESLTHGIIYDMDTDIRVILHVHSPDIWAHADRLHIPVTDAAVAYGTPAMAAEVRRLFTDTDVRHKGILGMAGHEDGIISFGTTAGEAGSVLLRSLAASLAAQELPD